MTDGVVTLDVVFRVVDIIDKLLQAKTILILALLLFFPHRGLHQFRALLRDQAHAVILAIVHMHHHIDGQIVSRDLHATRWREAGCRVTHNVVGHFVGRAAVCVCRFNVIAIAVIIEASELRCVQRIHIMTAIQTEAVDHVLFDILVETHARNLFENCSGEVQTQI